MATKKKAKKVARRKVKKRGLMVQTPVSRHLFPDVEFLRSYTDSLDWQKFARRSKDIEDCRFLINILTSHQPTAMSLVELDNNSIYRAVDNGISPMSVTGSFGCGGRFNVGAAQACEELRMLKPIGGLYGSLEAETAIVENSTHGLPGIPTLFELRARRRLRLYGLDAVLNDLEPTVLLPPHRSLTAAVLDIPMHADWKYRKYPAVSQVVGGWLRQHAGADVDGITWPSMRKPDGRNVFIFVRTDQDALDLFDCKQHDVG